MISPLTSTAEAPLVRYPIGSKPDPSVTSVNVPSWSFRRQRGREPTLWVSVVQDDEIEPGVAIEVGEEGHPPEAFVRDAGHGPDLGEPAATRRILIVAE